MPHYGKQIFYADFLVIHYKYFHFYKTLPNCSLQKLYWFNPCPQRIRMLLSPHHYQNRMFRIFNILNNMRGENHVKDKKVHLREVTQLTPNLSASGETTLGWIWGLLMLAAVVFPLARSRCFILETPGNKCMVWEERVFSSVRNFFNVRGKWTLGFEELKS